MRFLIAFSLVFLALAGCTSDAPAPGNETNEPNNGVAASIPAPVWEVGDWWAYTWSSGETPTLIVTEDAGSNWIVDVDDPDVAFGHQVFSQVSVLGEISKANLDGSQEAGPVKFFDFPLTQGKTWSLDWDGATYNAEAHLTPDGRARIEYTRDEFVERTVVYDPEMKWMRSMVAVDQNGTEQWSATLNRAGVSYAGEYVRWQIHQEQELSVDGAFGATSVGLTVVEGSQIWYHFMVQCNPDGLEGDQGTYAFKIGPQGAPPEHSEQGNCPLSTAFSSTIANPTPGQWTADVLSAGATPHGYFVVRTEERFSL